MTLVSFMTCSSNLQKMVFMDCLKTILSNISNGMDVERIINGVTVADCISDSDNAEETSIT
jgi:hypothetical protein